MGDLEGWFWPLDRKYMENVAGNRESLSLQTINLGTQKIYFAYQAHIKYLYLFWNNFYFFSFLINAEIFVCYLLLLILLSTELHKEILVSKMTKRNMNVFELIKWQKNINTLCNTDIIMNENLPFILVTIAKKLILDVES